MAKSLHRIVYVEDEPDIQVIARLALETLGGFEVTVCGSGAQALQVVPQVMPDLILLDVMMPQMDGPATLEALRRLPACAAIPVAFVTAKVQSTEISEFLEIGAIGVIGKPFDPMHLAQLVRDLWEDKVDGH